MVQNTPLHTENSIAGTGRGIVESFSAKERQLTSHPLPHPQWRSIFAGFFVGLSTLAVLSALGIAIGITAYDRMTEAWSAGATIWAIISVSLSFLVGGFVSARTAVGSSRPGLFHGFMVWAVTIPLLALVAGSGLPRIGGAGYTNLSIMSAPADRIEVARDANSSGDAKSAAMKAAWGTFVCLLLGLGAATLGGYIGGKVPSTYETVTTREVVV